MCTLKKEINKLGMQLKKKKLQKEKKLKLPITHQNGNPEKLKERLIKLKVKKKTPLN